jgi:hypothetical protein
MSPATDPDQATIIADDTVDVATDPEESHTICTGMTISAEEQVSTGDYESYTPYASRQVVFRPAIDISTPGGRVRVRREALKIHRDLQNDLQDAIDARLSSPGFNDWPDGVDAVDPDDDGTGTHDDTTDDGEIDG